MPRKLRIEFAGACYHVLNRGNYRADILATTGARYAFEAALFQACTRAGWILHAFVIMRNHYHLAIETPEANLVPGMHWLQGTFSNRFNQLRNERGHLFQGRYKALLVEPGNPLVQVCHYIHLNPVRAGVTSVECLGDYRHGSYWYLPRPAARPPFLQVGTALAGAGGLPDTVSGHRSYAAYLTWQSAHGPAGANAAYVSMSRGWAVGSQDFKAALLEEHDMVAQSRTSDSTGAAQVREMRWENALLRCLVRLKIREDAMAKYRKSTPWKIAIAAWMKAQTTATNGWLSARLHMGTPVAVSHYVSQVRRQPGHPAAELVRDLTLNLKA